MPQLSPMSWVLVIGIFLVCLVCFAVVVWWMVEGKYVIKYVSTSSKVVDGKKIIKWGFGSVLLKK
uniref:ATP synthase F0 subunit 8 n=1 Tax=Unio tumidus TaxID=143298 RepID=A0A1Q1MMV6_9BIVA|nr:ATP synthase F0 subunit 8 [Unio tumidus]AQM37847.1 ATP synthase F0 subunit 8 [Unio tumidus]AQM37861.1 ATP synthase F0 subunit 8 [Unio tumidus]